MSEKFIAVSAPVRDKQNGWNPYPARILVFS